MMTYLISKTKKNTTAVRFAIFILVVIVVRFVLTGQTSALVHFIARPFWNIALIMSDSSDDFFGGFTSRQELTRQNNELKKQLLELSITASTSTKLSQENRSLLALLGKQSTVKRRVAALVLETPLFAGYDMLIIDGGNDFGFVPGDIVFAGEHIAIGDIVSVYAHTAKVELYSSAKRKIKATFTTDSSIEIEAQGLGGGNFIAHVPHGVAVKEGDTLYLLGLENAVYSTVERIEARDTDPLQNIFFKLPVNVNELHFVSVEHQNEN